MIYVFIGGYFAMHMSSLTLGGTGVVMTMTMSTYQVSSDKGLIWGCTDLGSPFETLIVL